MFKNLLIGGLTLFSTIVHACWFTADNFNTCYIAGVNSYVSHYSPAESIGSAVYKNGQTVDFPLTVWVKVSDRFADQPGEAEGKKAIIHAVLQYRVLPNGRWKTVRELKNLNWDMDFQNPVALFGKNNVSIPGIAAGTEVLIRLYLSDGTYETGDLNATISDSIPDQVTQINGIYSGGWTAPFIMRVIASGKEKAH